MFSHPKMNEILKTLNKRSFRYGVPFLLIVLGGSFGLKEFTQLRYKYSRQTTVRDDIKKKGIELKDPSEITIEKEYERLQTMDIDNWEQVRGPRPWEETASA